MYNKAFILSLKQGGIMASRRRKRSASGNIKGLGILGAIFLGVISSFSSDKPKPTVDNSSQAAVQQVVKFDSPKSSVTPVIEIETEKSKPAEEKASHIRKEQPQRQNETTKVAKHSSQTKAKNRLNQTKKHPSKLQKSSAFQCGTKRLCGQMNSCAEARFHLTQCGLRRLDSDRDGIPCESLCGG